MSFEAASLKFGSRVIAGTAALPSVCQFSPNTSYGYCLYGAVELCGNILRAAATFDADRAPSLVPTSAVCCDDCSC